MRLRCPSPLHARNDSNSVLTASARTNATDMAKESLCSSSSPMASPIVLPGRFEMSRGA